MMFFRGANITGRGSAARFVTKEVGETEKRIREEADKCKQNPNESYCMFVDEFDSIGGDRSADVRTDLFIVVHEYKINR